MEIIVPNGADRRELSQTNEKCDREVIIRDILNRLQVLETNLDIYQKKVNEFLTFLET